MFSYIFQLSFGSDVNSSNVQIGYGAVLSIVAAFIVGIITVIYLKVSKKLDDYINSLYYKNLEMELIIWLVKTHSVKSTSTKIGIICLYIFNFFVLLTVYPIVYIVLVHLKKIKNYSWRVKSFTEKIYYI